MNLVNEAFPQWENAAPSIALSALKSSDETPTRTQESIWRFSVSQDGKKFAGVSVFSGNASSVFQAQMDDLEDSEVELEEALNWETENSVKMSGDALQHSVATRDLRNLWSPQLLIVDQERHATIDEQDEALRDLARASVKATDWKLLREMPAKKDRDPWLLYTRDRQNQAEFMGVADLTDSLKDTFQLAKMEIEEALHAFKETTKLSKEKLEFDYILLDRVSRYHYVRYMRYEMPW